MSRKCHLHLIKENMENAETITYFYCHGIKNSFWLSHYKNNLTSVKKNMLNLNELNIIVRNWYGFKVLWFELFSSHSRKCGDWFIGQYFIFGRKGGISHCWIYTKSCSLFSLQENITVDFDFWNQIVTQQTSFYSCNR